MQCNTVGGSCSLDTAAAAALFIKEKSRKSCFISLVTPLACMKYHVNADE